MLINVELVGWFQDKRFEKKTLSYPVSPSIHQIISDVGIPSTEVIIILINGTIADRESQVTDQDTVTMVPLVEGG